MRANVGGTWIDIGTDGAPGADATLTANSVDNTILANMNGNTIKGNNTGVSADPADLTVTATKTMLALNNVDNTSDAAKPVSTLTQTALNAKANSSVTVTGTGALTGGGALTGNQTISVATGGITKAMQENLAANSIRGNNTGSPAVPADLTVANVKAMLGLVTNKVTVSTTEPTGQVTGDLWIAY